ncbi:MAG: hypothetical protein CUN51_07005 [Candidatus Thermofonsia Clade 1 bacterium]|uniref:Uncharacterized protein n=1 Tax=Candidatus Thermofonsia Clade 1 bacterium TaxID=2364210 RepID=A0A2M8NZJ6_9CHLR|nr:MAG: hypothetical protein CUN51_07005 [Candidatus Thermofonsia Clade 1 bacterium]
MSDKRDDWSLRKEIQKRRTQQTPSTSKPSAPPPSARPTPPPPEPPTTRPTPRSTGTGPLPPSPIRRATYEEPPSEPPKPRRNTRPLLILGAVMAVVLIISVVILFVAPREAPPQPTVSYAEIKFRAEDVIEYLQRVGVPLSDLRALNVPSPVFFAEQGFQFLVVRGSQVGSYIVLSYDPAENLGRNALSLGNNPTYKDWRPFTAANIRVLYRPNNDPELDAEIESHLNALLNAPFRALFPTTTGSPVAVALIQTLTAQPTPTRIPPTATFVIVTRAPEERVTEAFTPQGGMFQVTVTPLPTLPPRELRPTSTPFPTRTPISAGFGAILTRAPGQPTLSLPGAPTATPQPISTAAEPPTATPFGTPPPTVPPGVLILNQTPVAVAILPTLAPQVENSASFNDRAPRFVDPFRLIPEASTTNKHGSTLLYMLPNGTQYLVVLWITNSPDEAFQRYSADLAAINGYQRVPVGEAGIVTAPQNYVLAMAIRANMVLIIYRPPEFATVPSDPVSVDQVTALLRALYEAIPVN